MKFIFNNINIYYSNVLLKFQGLQIYKMNVNNAEIILRLKNQLEKLYIDFDEFNNFLIKNNAILGGSFLLQIISNNFFEDKDEFDIDIFVLKDYDEIIKHGFSNIIRNSFIKKLFKEFNKTNIENFHDFKLYYNDCFYHETENIIIDNKYKNISKCVKDTLIYDYINSYSDLNNYAKIKQIVNFKTSKELIKQYQLIFFDNNLTHEHIMSNIDFEFCSNYWNGRELYIKNYESIIKRQCILKIDNTHIYRRNMMRIFKYYKRDYTITINLNGETYDMILLDTDDFINLKVHKMNDTNSNNVILSCSEKIIYSKNNIHFEKLIQQVEKYIFNLSNNIEKIIIYQHNHSVKLSKLPVALKELHLFCWMDNMCGKYNPKNKHDFNDEMIYGNLSYSQKREKIEELKKKTKKFFHIEEHNIQKILTIKKKIMTHLKIPFDCKLYLNKELLN